MKTFMTHTDPNAFIDHPMADQEEAKKMGFSCLCQKCKGHGGWNLELNAYPLRGKDNTPENRHKYSHFRAHCTNCHGWGYVNETCGDHIHEWSFVRNLGNCLNLHRCDTCGKEWEIDSSD